jgi:hypothetical protein
MRGQSALRVLDMSDHLLQRLKILFLLACGLGVAALTGWTGFAYKVMSDHRLSDQVAKLARERNAMQAQRDAALNKLEQLQQQPGDQPNIEAKLSAVGAEYNRLWQLAKANRLQSDRQVDSSPTGSFRKIDVQKRSW